MDYLPIVDLQFAKHLKPVEALHDLPRGVELTLYFLKENITLPQHCLSVYHSAEFPVLVDCSL